MGHIASNPRVTAVSFREVALSDHACANPGDVLKRTGHLAVVKADTGYEVRNLSIDKLRYWGWHPPLAHRETLLGALAAMGRLHLGARVSS
ncbi:hypothetical protein AN189_12925 [Loktanella sp. 3ANDIMAR09]|uniref:hypothetical protein n=1 Tax=Loktanella sp. 3ANDIMAR09 TaxID=1225657 RepID=UPI000701BFDE|nr:hypothetical protein [Loktanella sp. 3ANDIMAR09]KQI67976.1 hypothetical protein AN189_12925 [Loktanella sp. 3ANDIMAR09]